MSSSFGKRSQGCRTLAGARCTETTPLVGAKLRWQQGWLRSLLTICLMAGTSVAIAESLFHPPQRLLADGAAVNVGVRSAPFLADYDEDGLDDLWVGQFTDGRLNIYRNVGSFDRPRYDRGIQLRAEGEECSIPGG